MNNSPLATYGIKIWNIKGNVTGEVLLTCLMRISVCLHDGKGFGDAGLIHT
jgi:hypothetical protein